MKINLKETTLTHAFRSAAAALGIVVAAFAPAYAKQGSAEARKDPSEIAALLTLAGDEYALGVTEAGRVANATEYEETLLFLDAVEEAVAGLIAEAGGAGGAGGAPVKLAAHVDSARAVVERVGAPAELERWLEAAMALLTREWGARLLEWPRRDPSVVAGRRLYGSSCASCHGSTGRGDGPLAGELEPPPPDLTAVGDAPPARLFQVVSYGIRGTAMPGVRDRLSVEERWDLVAFVRSLGGDSASTAAYVRGRGVDFASVRTLVASAVDRSRAGAVDDAAEEARRAYLEFEKAETSLRVREPSLTASLEQDFLVLRGAVRTRGDDARAVAARIDARLRQAERALATPPGRWSGIFESLTILVREGFEAMLIVSALLMFLTKMGHAERRRAVWVGVLAAVAGSIVTAVLIEAVFHWGPASQEALEGVTMLLATVVLFGVSYWLVSKIEHAAWERYIRGKIRSALDRGSDFALASAGFLAVYREGFETILFYKALLGSGARVDAVVVGVLLGALALAALFVAFYRFGVRIALRPFFAVTSGVLYYMAFVFAGKGVRELQEAGWLAATWVPGAPQIDGLGVYPTVETLAAQAALAVALGGALGWVFVVRPIRRKLESAVPEVSGERSST